MGKSAPKSQCGFPRAYCFTDIALRVRFNADISSFLRQKDKAYKKAVKTKEDKGLITPRDQINESQKYKELVRHLTEKTYRKNKKLLNPLNLPRGMERGKYHLDHKFSVSMGYINNIPVEIMASVYNLEIIESKENLVKHADCSITKEELLEAYYG